MTRFLLPAESVHAVAAACDYLTGRIRDGDAVTALAVQEPGEDPRDSQDALNVATARLSGLAPVATSHVTGDPVGEILSAAAEADEIVMGAGPDLVGSARAVIGRAAVPVVVVPVAGPD